jgi:hypothetical protein
MSNLYQLKWVVDKFLTVQRAHLVVENILIWYILYFIIHDANIHKCGSRK